MERARDRRRGVEARDAEECSPDKNTPSAAPVYPGTGAFLPKCFPLPCAAHGTNSTPAGRDRTGVLRARRLLWVQTPAPGWTPSASHSFQVSSIPRTVQARCASWNNSAPHPQRQYARLCRHPTRAPRHVAHTQGPARVSPSPDVRASSHDRVHRPGRLGALLWRSAFSGCVCLCVCLFFLSCPVVCPCVE